MKKLVMFTLAALMVFGLTACGSDDMDDLYVNSNSSKLKVNNGSPDDLLLYTASPAESRPIAGVRGGQQGWGVLNAPSGLYVLYVVSQHEYDLNPADPKMSMSQLVYVDNEASTYEVSSGSVGNCEIVVNNDSKYYVEVRNNHFGGSVFLTVRPWEHGSKFVTENDYYLYPLVKVERKDASGNILGVYSKNLEGGRRMLGAVPNVIKYLNVTPTDIVNNLAVECLIYISNQLSSGDAEVHAGSAEGDLILNTLGRRLASGSAPFVISLRPGDIGPNGDPTVTEFGRGFVLKSFTQTSDVYYKADFQVGKAYMLTCSPDGHWTAGSVNDLVVD